MLLITTFCSVGGESGIRTRGTLLEYTHFPGVLLKPLGHLSKKIVAKITQYFVRKNIFSIFFIFRSRSSRPGWEFEANQALSVGADPRP